MYYTHNTFRLYTEDLLDTSGDERRFLRALSMHTDQLRCIELKICDHDNHYKLSLDSTKRSFILQQVLEDVEEKEGCAVSEPERTEHAQDILRSVLAQKRPKFGLSVRDLLDVGVSLRL